MKCCVGVSAEKFLSASIVYDVGIYIGGGSVAERGSLVRDGDLNAGDPGSNPDSNY